MGKNTSYSVVLSKLKPPPEQVILAVFVPKLPFSVGIPVKVTVAVSKSPLTFALPFGLSLC
ncbi:MAG: hypothetical protein LBM70_02390 [Victivallales bacterium]|nr:hypothetical protein [Victivallales bacterium]